MLQSACLGEKLKNEPQRLSASASNTTVHQREEHRDLTQKTSRYSRPMNKVTHVLRFGPWLSFACLLGLWTPASTHTFAPESPRTAASSLRLAQAQLSLHEIHRSAALHNLHGLPPRISYAGLALIKRSETLRLRAYESPDGDATIGWGHTRTAKRGMWINEHSATQLLSSDLRRAEQAVMRLVRVPLTRAQFDALVSFVFNVGVGNFSRSTLLRRVNDRQFHAVPNELMKWTKIRVDGNPVQLRGLVIRRAAEARLFDAPPSDQPVVLLQTLGAAPNT